MKRIFAIGVILVVIFECFSTNVEANVKGKPEKLPSKIEVYYFHFSRRCPTCMAVEAVSEKAVESLYPEQIKKGIISFKGINLDESASKLIAHKCGVSAQCLLIKTNSKKIDLTTQGFMYARNNPDKLKQEIKKAIDPLLYQ